MRLKKEQVQKIGELILKGLLSKKLAVLKVPEEKLLHRIIEIMTHDLQSEDKLDAEVRQLMEKFKTQIASGQMDSQKVFQMIKKQLIKDRNLVI